MEPAEPADPAEPAEPERLVEPEPPVLEGDDELPRQPTLQRDPFVPEPYARPGEGRAWRSMRLAVIPVLIAVAIVIYAAFR